MTNPKMLNKAQIVPLYDFAVSSLTTLSSPSTFITSLAIDFSPNACFSILYILSQTKSKAARIKFFSRLLPYRKVQPNFPKHPNFPAKVQFPQESSRENRHAIVRHRFANN